MPGPIGNCCQKSRALDIREAAASPDTSGLAAKSITVRLGAGNTEADVVVAVIRIVAVPVDGTDVVSRIVPASAAIHAVRPRGRAHVTQYYGNSWLAQAVSAP